MSSRAVRKRLAPTTALLAALIVAVLAAAAGFGAHRAGASAPPVRDAARSGCAVVTPTSAAGYAAALDALGQGGDATLSVPLRSGRVAWIFADTLVPGVGMPHSTVVVEDRGCFGATRRQLLPNDRDGTYWWPNAAVALPNGAVLVTAVNGFGVKMRGAICRERRGALVFDHWLRSWPQPAGGHTGTYFGAGLLVDGPRLLVYGTRLTGRPLVFGRELYLATVPIAGLESGRGWALGTTPIFGATPHGTDHAVAPYRDRSGYHLVTLLDGVYGNGPVVSLDSTRPDGPFTVRSLFSYSRPGQLRYSAAVHPEAKLSQGGLLVTVNNNWPLNDHRLHPVGTYQPSFFMASRTTNAS